MRLPAQNAQGAGKESRMDDGTCISGGPKKETVEESLRSLEGLMESLEDPDTPLEESFALYEKGLKLVREISSRIDRVEKQMIVLEEEGHE